MKSFLKHKLIQQATLLAYHGNQPFLEENKGQMTSDSPFALASISKLYTYAIIFQLIDQNMLTYETSLTDVLAKEMTNRLPNANQVTVRQLLDQTTGFPNYEMDRQENGKILIEEILQQDRRVEWDEALAILADLPAKSQLGGSKAYYADVNAMLLGKMAEAVTGWTPAQLLEASVSKPLNLSQTHWATGHKMISPICDGQQTVACQHYLASQLYQGGIISTNRDLMTFIRAFFTGQLFEKSHIENPHFRPIQFRPVKYGSGLMQLTVGPFISLFFGGAREIRGHSGITGSFAFYCPDKDIFVTGTINQLKKRPYPMIFGAIAAGDRK